MESKYTVGDYFCKKDKSIWKITHVIRFIMPNGSIWFRYDLCCIYSNDPLQVLVGRDHFEDELYMDIYYTQVNAQAYDILYGNKT